MLLLVVIGMNCLLFPFISQPPPSQSQGKDIKEKKESGPDSEVSHCCGNNIKYYLLFKYAYVVNCPGVLIKTVAVNYGLGHRSVFKILLALDTRCLNLEVSQRHSCKGLLSLFKLRKQSSSFVLRKPASLLFKYKSLKQPELIRHINIW